MVALRTETIAGIFFANIISCPSTKVENTTNKFKTLQHTVTKKTSKK
jgi:hypothetical protein